MKWRSERGFTLPMAVFLIVVVALLVAFMVSIASVQQRQSALSIVGDRVFFAAQSGVEWGAARALRDNDCATNFPATFLVTGDVSVTLLCAEQTFTEGTDPAYKVFELQATASRGVFGSDDYFQRELNVTVTAAP